MFITTNRKMKTYIFLASGFEETEYIATIDLLRRAKIDVESISISEEKEVIGAHNIVILADKVFSEVDFSDAEMLILPGGMPGTNNLNNFKPLLEILKKHYSENKPIAAICAAPLIFGQLGFLENQKACCYPGFEQELKGANVLDCSAVTSGEVITGQSAGGVFDFALQIISKLRGKELAQQISEQIIY